MKSKYLSRYVTGVIREIEVLRLDALCFNSDNEAPGDVVKALVKMYY